MLEISDHFNFSEEQQLFQAVLSQEGLNSMENYNLKRNVRKKTDHYICCENINLSG